MEKERKRVGNLFKYIIFVQNRNAFVTFMLKITWGILTHIYIIIDQYQDDYYTIASLSKFFLLKQVKTKAKGQTN